MKLHELTTETDRKRFIPSCLSAPTDNHCYCYCRPVFVGSLESNPIGAFVIDPSKDQSRQVDVLA